MCKPIEGNLVHPKTEIDVVPLAGSSRSLIRKAHKGTSFTLTKDNKGLTEGPDPNAPNCFIVLFDWGRRAILRVSLPHTQLKGVELQT